MELTDEQKKQINILLSRAIADGFGVVSIEVVNGKIEFIGLFQKYKLTDRPRRGYEPKHLYAEEQACYTGNKPD
jgi:hypothetical protein